MKSLSRSFLWSMALATTAFPPLLATSASAQDVYPDWHQVWNQETPPQPQSSDISVPANVVVPVMLDRSLSSQTARVGDIVTTTVVSRTPGDSEFPPGTRLGGVVSQAQPAYGNTPGVLDVDFQSVLLPDGTDVPIHGFIASLDSNAIRTSDGHLIARDGSHVNAWKAVGIGGGLGFVLGRLLKTRTLLPTILGAAGGYLYARDNTVSGADASINGGTTLGVRLESGVSYPDTTGYATTRLNFLETHRVTQPTYVYRPQYYGWNPYVCAPPTYGYTNFTFIYGRPGWVDSWSTDYYGCPIFSTWAARPSFNFYYVNTPRWQPNYWRPYCDNWRPNPYWNTHPYVPIRRFGDGTPFIPTPGGLGSTYYNTRITNNPYSNNGRRPQGGPDRGFGARSWNNRTTVNVTNNVTVIDRVATPQSQPDWSLSRPHPNAFSPVAPTRPFIPSAKPALPAPNPTQNFGWRNASDGFGWNTANPRRRESEPLRAFSTPSPRAQAPRFESKTSLPAPNVFGSRPEPLRGSPRENRVFSSGGWHGQSRNSDDRKNRR